MTNHTRLLTIVGILTLAAVPYSSGREVDVTIVQPTSWVRSSAGNTPGVLVPKFAPGVKEARGTKIATSPPAPRNGNGTHQQLVQFTDQTTPEAVATKLQTPLENISRLNARTYAVTSNVDPATLPGVQSVEPNAVYQTLIRPNDASFGNQVGMSNVSATDAWDIEQGYSGARIAVIDTGVDGLHEDLYGKVIEGYDFVNDHPIGRYTNSDDNGHGTAVASIAAANTNNGTGMAGMDWAAEIMPVKVLNGQGIGYTREVVLGIDYAIDRGANVILMSIGSTEDSTLLDQAITDAWNRNILVIAAAGNDGPGDVLYPAHFDKVLSVGATDGNDNWASFSAVGLSLDVVAPGVDITYADATTGGYKRGNGTSLAAPFVAGTAALIKSRYPGLTTQQLFDAIRNHTDNVAGMAGAGRTDFYGYGRLNAAKALRSIAGDYHGLLISRTENIPPLGSTQSWPIQYQYRNTGTSVWKNNGPYRMELATTNPTDQILPFTREDLVNHNPSGWLSPNRVQMVENEVRPGQTGTFRFWVSVPSGMTAGDYTESMQLNVRDVGPVADTAASFSIRVLSELDRYHAQWDGQSPNPTLSAGQSAQFLVRLKNVGNATWTSSTVALGTSHDQDRISRFTREDLVNHNSSGWIAPNRVTLGQSAIAPGQVGTFTFYLSVPAGTPAGTYREYFQPVAQGLGWMEDLGIYWDITVQ